MMSSMGGSSVDMNTLAEIVKSVPGLDHNFTNQMYAAGGKGGAHAHASAEPDFGDLMKAFMPKKDGEDRAPAGSSEANFGKAPAMNVANATAEDRKVSIFDRVTYRYGVMKQKWSERLPGPDMK